MRKRRNDNDHPIEGLMTDPYEIMKATRELDQMVSSQFKEAIDKERFLDTQQ